MSKTILQQKRDDLAATLKEIDALEATSRNRDLSGDEAGRFDSLIGKAQSLSAECDRLATGATAVDSARKTLAYLDKPVRLANPGQPQRMPSSTFDGAHSNPYAHLGEGVSLWRDLNSGAIVPGLSKQHRLADLHEASGDIAPNAIGRIIQAHISGRGDSIGDLRAAMGEGNNFTGGYLVPSELASTWIDALRAKSVLVIAGAQTIPVSSETMTIARVATDPTIAPKNENAAFTETSIGFDAINFVPKTIGAVIYASRELAADAPNFAQLVEQVLARKMAQQVDAWGLCGTGISSDIGGVMNLDGVTTTDGNVASIASTQYDEVIDAIEDVQTANGEPSAIITTPAVTAIYRKLRTGDGTNSSKNYLDVPEPVRSLPWLTTTAATAGELYVGQWNSCLIGLRQAALIEFTTTAGDTFAKHQMGIKITMRLDVNAQHANLFAKLKGITA